jgi:hypothetical protein
MEKELLMEFVEWCEKNENTEWLGYYVRAEKVIDEFLKWKASNRKENE